MGSGGRTTQGVQGKVPRGRGRVTRSDLHSKSKRGPDGGPDLTF